MSQKKISSHNNKKINIDYSKQHYVVSGRRGYSLAETLSLWKAKYPEFADFKKDVITHENLEDFGKFVEECWDHIIPVTAQDALKIENTEDRRVYFDCIGVSNLFKQLNPQLRDRQVIKKKRTKWDDNNDPIEYEFEDVYELYEIEGTKLYPVDRWGRVPNSIYAVRCWCTTTNREYWLYVNDQAALGESRWSEKVSDKRYDAIRAIAWTIRVDIEPENIEKIYRQGDIIIAKFKSGLKQPFERISYQRHLEKEQYLNLMYSET